MKKPHAQWLTLHKADIDQDISIEILWQTQLNTLHLLLFRIQHSGGRVHLTTETIGPYHSLAELRQQLCVLFGELPAKRICHNPSSWLSPYHQGLPTASPSATVGSAKALPTRGIPTPGGHLRSPLLELYVRSSQCRSKEKNRPPSFCRLRRPDCGLV
jgi:hypothetical protein